MDLMAIEEVFELMLVEFLNKGKLSPQFYINGKKKTISCYRQKKYLLDQYMVVSRKILFTGPALDKIYIVSLL